jgi:hypothetical protein
VLVFVTGWEDSVVSRSFFQKLLEKGALIVQAPDLLREALDLAFKIHEPFLEEIVGLAKAAPLQAGSQGPAHLGVEDDSQDGNQEHQDEEYLPEHGANLRRFGAKSH